MSVSTPNPAPGTSNAFVDWLRNREPALVALLVAFIIRVGASFLLRYSITLSGTAEFWISQVLNLVLGAAALWLIRKLVVPLGKLQKALGDLGTKLLLQAADQAMPAAVATPEGTTGPVEVPADGTDASFQPAQSQTNANTAPVTITDATSTDPNALLNGQPLPPPDDTNGPQDAPDGSPDVDSQDGPDTPSTPPTTPPAA